MVKRMNYKSITTAKKRRRTGICLFLTLIFLVSAFLPANVSADATNPPEKTEATVKKVWNDDSNRDGIRPDALTLTLNGLPDGFDAPDPSITKSGDTWTYTWSNLPKNDNGEPIEYTISEETVPTGYTCKETTVDAGGTITNSHTPEKTEATVRKIWDDDDDRDRKRPDSLTVSLSNGQSVPLETVTLNDDNGYSATIYGLLKYENGEEIAYTWTESGLPEGYWLTDTSVNGTITELVNSHTPEKTEATVKKVWDDDNNRDGKRPASLSVTLSNGRSITLNDDNGWSATITGLFKYKDGDLIEYTWTEGSLPEGYTLTDTSVNGTVTSFTNSYTPEETEATVKKVWDDDDDWYGKRPDSLTVTLSNGQSVTLNEDNGWTGTITGLYKYEAGEEIKYSWSEGQMPQGYILSDTSVNGTVTTLTDSYLPVKTDIAVTKIWYDYNNAGNTRPGSVQVQLTSDGKNFGYPVTLSSENNWSYIWKILPKYHQGTEIGYSVVEITNLDNYQIGDPQTGSSGITITNVYNPTPVSVDPPVRKIFRGKDDLYNNGMYTFTIENTEAPDGVPVPMPEHTSITNSPEYELSNKSGYYEFGEIRFIIPGTYKYTIRESGSVKNVVNDPDAETGKTLTFVVTDDGSGILSVSPTTDKVDLSFTNTYSSSGSINFEAVIFLEQGDLKDGQFSFELLDNEGNLIGTISNSANGSAIFPGITYTQEDIGKTFIYTIRAVIPDDPDEQIIYDDTEYTVTVTVSADAEGTLVINSDHPDPFKFTNTQKNPLSLVFGGHKTLPKLPREGDLPFRFQLFEILEDGIENPAAVASCTGSADYQFPAITYTEPGTYQYVVREIPDNLPGVTYDKREYRFTVTVTENPDVELTAEISGDDPENLNFTNIYKEIHEKPPLTLLPKTGFSAVRRQSLPQQPKDIRYRQLGWNLQIPSLELMTNIVGVPEVEGEYPVTWLGGQAGLLEGYPMPGQGRTILTGHNHLNDTEAGPFAFLLYMNEGDRIFVRDPRGNLLVYSVYANEKIGNAEIEEMERISDEFENSITLITCEDEQENGEYINRRIIAARPLM